MQFWEVRKGPAFPVPYGRHSPRGSLHTGFGFAVCLSPAALVRGLAQALSALACLGGGQAPAGGGDVFPMKASLQAEEAEREERKRLESQREAEWKKEEERLRLEEEQKVR